MAQQRWRRLLPDRSQLWILAAVLVVIFAGASFFNVVSAKSAAVTKQRARQAQLVQLEEQHRLLQEARDARGEDVELLARRYFRYGFTGETRVIGQVTTATEQAASGSAVAATGPEPVWQGWLRELSSILTNVQKWLQ